MTLLLLGAKPAAAQYQWKDQQGQTHLSDRPPPREIPDKDVLKRPAARERAAPAAALASAVSDAKMPDKPTVDPELEARRKRADEQASARNRAAAQRLEADQAENCLRARQQLATLNSGQRLVRQTENGERLVLDDAARASEVQTARRAIAVDCR
jgi:hypothetical protein